MKATLKLEDGREIAVDVNEEILKQIEKPKKTGYERVDLGDRYYYFDGWEVDDHSEDIEDADDDIYDGANYYSDKTIAENNARADRLHRQLRRFAVEHREHELDWGNERQSKFHIDYWCGDGKLYVGFYNVIKTFGVIWFDSKEAAEAAIEEFKDELIWYFTEYKDSL